MSAPVSETTLNRRISTVDLLRGFLMIVMALDHTRDFFSSARVDPVDPLASWPAMYFARWITHLCAPGFVALAGTSVYLQRQKGRSATDMAKKLVARGLWLLFLEIALINFGIFFTYKVHLMQVIYGIGGSMVLLAALQYLPVRVVGLYGLLVVTLHNLIDKVPPPTSDFVRGAGELLLTGGVFPLHGRPNWFVAYPWIPWSGVMALGYAFGVVVMKSPQTRRKISAALGAVLLAVFAVLRAVHAYGDPITFERLNSTTRSAMSFWDVTKYPPSLHYWLATTGILLLIFALSDLALTRGWAKRALGVVEIYGRVPFFYYLLHFYLLHVMMLVIFKITMHAWPHYVVFFGTPPAGWGFGLPGVYLIWFSAVAALYPACKWFAGVKARRRDWWLSYL